MIPPQLIYCYWIWFWTPLYLFNIIKISPAPSALLALIYTLWATWFSPYTYAFTLQFQIFITLFESIILFLLLLKSKYKITHIYENIIVFSIYTAVLFLHNTNFYQIYFVDVPNHIENSNGLYSHLEMRFQSIFLKPLRYIGLPI